MCVYKISPGSCELPRLSLSYGRRFEIYLYRSSTVRVESDDDSLEFH